MKMELRRKAIDKIYKRRDRIEMPDYQREEVWPVEKKRLLIDSILQNWHLPKFYFRKLEDGTLDCVDGQQRLAAIFEFFAGQLRLNSDTAKRVGGSTYDELPDNVSDAFDDYEIDIEEIEETSDRVLEEVFKRLQLGTPLNTAEKLKAEGGDLRDFCLKMSKEPFFSEKIALKDTRYAHFERVVRWVFIEAREIRPQMRLPQLESLLKDNRSYSENSDTAKRVKIALSYLDRAFPDKCPFLWSRANILSVCMLASRVVGQGLHDGTAEEFGKFIQEFFTRLAAEVEKGVKGTERELLRYQQAITSDSAGGESIKARINILTKRLATCTPCFSPLLGYYNDAETAAVRDLKELASDGRDLLYNVNRKFSASHGEDLFKMTTESSAALSKIGIPCRDSQQYGSFVDALYFLIYEGSGDCKRLPSPPPDFAMDVKFLRTWIRHDLNHGKAKHVEKKRIRSAQIFERYSYKKSLGECSPEDFLSTQIRILNALISFLTDLLKP